MMAIGESGRIVLEIEPALKKKIYACLALEQMSLKDWFIKAIEEHMQCNHPEIFTTKNNKK
ncbi:hypothetical protein [Janthinobacterium sp. NKUCC08_JDC]|uniref:hypothetical protein n=1 Tax=Janthinobacterium sp. NKUCC08_JDC TaxID=2842122 RepID=UPI001C5ABE8C|nr:hypothetical protein [Janthinobacterium sp. NKUCC08_JDC]MBW3502250.1 hypothetical protein [Janthinobacterium sp. NKUCC08_JDC]